MEKRPKLTLEKIIPFNWSPLLFWPLIGFLIFWLGEILIRVFQQEYLFWNRFFFTINFSLLPLVFIKSIKDLRLALYPLSNILWISTDEFEKWVSIKIDSLIGYNSLLNKGIKIVSIIFAIVTITILGLPFQNLYLNIFSLAFLFVFTLINAQGAYMAIKGIQFSIELLEREIHVPFFVETKSKVIKLQNLFSFGTLAITIGLIFFTLGIWKSPYGITHELQIWLAVGTLFPPIFLIVTFDKVHKLMQKMKYKNLDLVNDELQNFYIKSLKNPKKNIEKLSFFMDIQEKISNGREWPFDLAGVVSLILSLLLATVQLLNALGVFDNIP
jgi:hypothetical protein